MAISMSAGRDLLAVGEDQDVLETPGDVDVPVARCAPGRRCAASRLASRTRAVAAWLFQ